MIRSYIQQKQFIRIFVGAVAGKHGKNGTGALWYVLSKVINYRVNLVRACPIRQTSCWESECFPSAYLWAPLGHLAEFHAILFSFTSAFLASLWHTARERVGTWGTPDALAALLCPQDYVAGSTCGEPEGGWTSIGLYRISIDLSRTHVECLRRLDFQTYLSILKLLRFLQFPFALKTPLPFLGNEERLEINLIVIYLPVSSHAACSSLLTVSTFSLFPSNLFAAW